MPKEAKTNAMRMLERAKVAYSAHEYPHEEGQAVDGANVARLTGQDPAKVFKTLVTQGADRNYYVFVVPVLAELDLKKAAKAAGVKQDMGFITTQIGMFSYSGLSKDQMVRLRSEFGVYGTDTGRMCVAALNSKNIEHVCASIAKVVA